MPSSIETSTNADTRPRKKLGLRPFLLAGVMVFTIAQIVALSPSSVEESSAPRSISPEALTPDATERTLATGIPTDRIPDYSVDQFNYLSTQNGLKQWKLVADKAYLFNREKLVHARRITAHLYNPDGQITVVTGREAKYFMNQRDLEVFGDVKTKFPDGFETESEYLRYRPNQGMIEVPVQYPVKGGGKEASSQSLAFESNGMEFSMKSAQIILPSKVRLSMAKEDSSLTTVESDRCIIFRDKQLAQFTMSSKRPPETRFVKINQPTLFVHSRRADLNYGNFAQVLQYLVAYDDVLIKEKNKTSNLRYGTAGRADFDTHREVVVLRDFPQVYQNNDTVTGDIIIVHRDTDVIEVEHSNAFSEGIQSVPR